MHRQKFWQLSVFSATCALKGSSRASSYRYTSTTRTLASVTDTCAVSASTASRSRTKSEHTLDECTAYPTNSRDRLLGFRCKHQSLCTKYGMVLGIPIDYLTVIDIRVVVDTRFCILRMILGISVINFTVLFGRLWFIFLLPSLVGYKVVIIRCFMRVLVIIRRG